MSKILPFHSWGLGPNNQGLKKCKFPGKLVEISREPQVEHNRPFMMSQKERVFLENVALKSLNYHCVHIQWFLTWALLTFRGAEILRGALYSEGVTIFTSLQICFSSSAISRSMYTRALYRSTSSMVTA